MFLPWIGKLTVALVLLKIVELVPGSKGSNSRQRQGQLTSSGQKGQSTTGWDQHRFQNPSSASVYTNRENVNPYSSSGSGGGGSKSKNVPGFLPFSSTPSKFSQFSRSSNESVAYPPPPVQYYSSSSSSAPSQNYRPVGGAEGENPPPPLKLNPPPIQPPLPPLPPPKIPGPKPGPGPGPLLPGPELGPGPEPGPGPEGPKPPLPPPPPIKPFAIPFELPIPALPPPRPPAQLMTLGFDKIVLLIVPQFKIPIKTQKWWEAKVKLSLPITVFFDKLAVPAGSPPLIFFPFGPLVPASGKEPESRGKRSVSDNRIDDTDNDEERQGKEPSLNKNAGSILSLPPPESVKGGERASLVPRLENIVESFGVEGRSCVLRAVCEVHQHYLSESYGLMGEILTLLFTVSNSAYAESHLPEYYKAEQLGKSGHCSSYFRNCTQSILHPYEEDEDDDEDDDDEDEDEDDEDDDNYNFFTEW